jgi:ubiquinone/menaquinone biosynthesis C-methylase UbiE
VNGVTSTMAMVKDYYGRVLRTSGDLKTTACCVAESLPPDIAAIVAQIHVEVRERFFGCGVIAPAELEGRTVLDLGSGSGRDAFVLSKLVGPRGRVIGIDMTDEQLAVGRRHLDYHAKAFGHPSSNVSFLKGYIEDLEATGIASESVDVVVSNCVINLSPAKERVFREIFRVLKPGGELHFSDVFADRRLAKSLMEDPVLLGECLGGAMYVEDFRRTMQAVGCHDARVLSRSPLAVTDAGIAQKLGNARFESITVRAFKVELEDRCEDYGQVAYYRGSIAGAPHAYRLDDHHVFETGRPLLVCSNTANMLMQTRLAPHFRVEGDLSTHFGLFPCGPSPTAGGTAGGASSGAACC